MTTMREKAAGLRAFLSELQTFRVRRWGGPNGEYPTEPGEDREPVPMDKAHVASSLRHDGRHAVVLDIDHPAWLVESSTPGHFHLYIDVPGGIENEKYMPLLGALADVGIIEPGYASASQARGHSDVRLPWIKKGQEDW